MLNFKSIININMKGKALFSVFVVLFVMGCSGNEEKVAKVSVQNGLLQTVGNDRYELYPTTNMWNFIKLDTQTGVMKMVQYTVKEDDVPFEYSLSDEVLVSPSQARVNGRFELHKTQNMYNYILLDKIDGRTWQVQWSFEENRRFVIPISK